MTVLVVIERMRSRKTCRMEVVRVHGRGRNLRVHRSGPSVATMAELQDALETCRMLAAAG